MENMNEPTAKYIIHKLIKKRTELEKNKDFENVNIINKAIVNFLIHIYQKNLNSNRLKFRKDLNADLKNAGKFLMITLL